MLPRHLTLPSTKWRVFIYRVDGVFALHRQGFTRVGSKVALEFDTALKFCSQINPDWTLRRQNAGRSLLRSPIFNLVGNAESQQNVVKYLKGNRAQLEVSHSRLRDGAVPVLLLRAHSPAGHSRGAPHCRPLRTTFYFLYFSVDLQNFLKKIRCSNLAIKLKTSDTDYWGMW